MPECNIKSRARGFISHALPALMLVSGYVGHIKAAPLAAIPLSRAHAHNDYEHKRPLWDALEHGFCSVEADIHLVDGELLVAHDRKACKPDKTLQSMYLEPLRQLARENGGRIYPNGPECTLLIDIKGDWKTTYPVLRELLKQYAGILTTFEAGKKQSRAVLAIITGNRSKSMFQGETIRYAAYDGEMEDLTSDAPADLVPWFSANWAVNFLWRGTGEIPDTERAKLREMVEKAHARGRKVRFWGAPDRSTFWREALSDGVDLINTDDLPGLQKFLFENNGK